MGLGQGERGYAMAALLIGLSVLAVLMTMALPVWTHYAKREKEEELIWRGQQYARAIGLFQRKYANTFPPNLQVLLDQKFLRKKYKDPITNDDFQLIPAGGGMPGMGGGPGNASPGQPGLPRTQGPTKAPGADGTPAISGTFEPVQGRGPGTPAIGIQGVVSKSSDKSIKLYNGRNKYNEWAFIYLATAQRVGGRGVAQPGVGQQGSPFPGMGPPGSQPPIGSPAVPFGASPGGMGAPPPGQPPATSPFGQPRTQPTRPPVPRPPDR